MAKSVNIGIVLDKSGSMESMKTEVVTGFNEQIETIRKANPDANVSFYTFATSVREEYFNEKLDKVMPLTPESYKPSGWTALYDAVGSLIDKFASLPNADSEDTTYLVMVVSDGAENSSKEYTKESIAEKIKAKTATGRWTFTYLGANQDLGKVSKELHIPAGNTMSFAATKGGAARGMHVNSESVKDYLGSKKQQTSKFFTQ